MNEHDKILNLEQKVTTLEIQIKQCFDKIQQLEESRIILDPYTYNPEATVVAKIKLVITQLDTPCTIKMIIEGLNQLDKSTLLSQQNPNKYLSPFLHRAIKYEVLRKIKLEGIKSHIYCLPQWFEGEILSSFYRKRLPIL